MTVDGTQQPPVAEVESSQDFGNFDKITEGKATILFPRANEVFYNPVQEYNRDLSTAVIRQWAADFRLEKEQQRLKKASRKSSSNDIQVDMESVPTSTPPQQPVEQSSQTEEVKAPVLKFRALEALSASGLRSIRYALEMDDILENIVANDMSATAVESIRRNARYNGLSEDRVRPNQSDAK